MHIILNKNIEKNVTNRKNVPIAPIKKNVFNVHSRPYLSNDRTYGTVVICLSVCNRCKP